MKIISQDIKECSQWVTLYCEITKYFTKDLLKKLNVDDNNFTAYINKYAKYGLLQPDTFNYKFVSEFNGFLIDCPCNILKLNLQDTSDLDLFLSCHVNDLIGKLKARIEWPIVRIENDSIQFYSIDFETNTERDVRLNRKVYFNSIDLIKKKFQINDNVQLGELYNELKTFYSKNHE